MKKFIMLISMTIILFPSKIVATSGFLRAATIKECEGNTYGQHGSDNHWHLAVKNENGSYSAKGDAIYTDPCPANSDIKENNNSETTNINTSQNNDTSLKEITINDEIISIKDTMEYKTREEKVDLKIKASDDNAKVEYNQIDNLKIGNNIINIKVIAQDGTEAKYVLIIAREEALNANTEIEVKIAGEKIAFDNYRYAMEVKNNVTELDIDYTLSSDKSIAKIEGNKDFVTGKNEVKILVTAENGDSQEYVIVVTKLDWFNSIIKVILGSSVVVAIIAFAKKIFKK